MATTAPFEITTTAPVRPSTGLRQALIILACAALPLGLFGLVNLGAEALGILPLFFAPYGMPGWIGAIVHLAQLALLGAAFGVLMHQPHAAARHWLAALTLAYVLLPFITPPLDSLQLSLVCTSLTLIALATLLRVGRLSPLAGWLMTPALIVLGLSATMGLALAAAFAPPFALVQGQATPPA